MTQKRTSNSAKPFSRHSLGRFGFYLLSIYLSTQLACTIFPANSGKASERQPLSSKKEQIGEPSTKILQDQLRKISTVADKSITSPWQAVLTAREQLSSNRHPGRELSLNIAELSGITKDSAAYLDSQILLSQVGNSALSLKELEKLSKKAKRSDLEPEVHYLRAKKAFAAKDLSSAYQQRRILRASFPLSSWTKRSLKERPSLFQEIKALPSKEVKQEAQLLNREKRYGKVVRLAQKQLEILHPSKDPSYYDFLQLKVEALFEMGLLAKGTTALNILLNDASRERAFQAQISAVQKLWNKNKTKEALKLSRRSSKRLKSFQKSERYQFIQAKMLEELGQHEEASVRYKILAQKTKSLKQKVKFLKSLAWLALTDQQRPKAVSYFKEIRSSLKKNRNQEWLHATYWIARLDPMKSELFDEVITFFPESYYGVLAREAVNRKSDSEVLLQASCKSDFEKNKLPKKPQALKELGAEELALRELNWSIAQGKIAKEKNRWDYAQTLATLGAHHEALRLATALKSETRCQDKLKTQLQYPLPFPETYKSFSKTHSLELAEVLALSRTESHFNSQAHSPVGALGLMQLMPETAQKEGIKKNDDILHPEVNIRLGVKHLGRLAKTFPGDGYLKLAAYNAGEDAVRAWQKRFGKIAADEFIERIPYSETRNYVKKIIRDRDIYRKLLMAE